MFGQPLQTTSNKQVCQFYQRGQCKYGTKCWNLHPGGGTATGNVFGAGSSSAGLFSNFGGGNANSSLQDKQFIEFVNQVTTEMVYWEDSGMWLLSSLAPLKEHPLLTGFVDTAPEEMRVEAYEALNTNTFPNIGKGDSYSKKLEYHKQIREALKNQTPEAIEALRAVFYKTGSTTTGLSSTGEQIQATSLFGKPATSSLFKEGPSNQASLFGNSGNNQTSVFGNSSSGANSLFGAKPQNSAFGAAPVFGSTNQTFGSSNAFKSSSGGVFGAQASSSLFGGGSAGQGQSLFGNAPSTTSLFGGGSQFQQNTPNVFGSTQTSGMPSVFGGANQNQATPNLFGNANQTQGNLNTFGGASTALGTSNIFGSAVQNQGMSSSLFGGAIQNQEATNVFGTANQTQATSVDVSNNTQPLINNPPSLFGTSSNSLFGGNINNNLTNSNGSSLFNNVFAADTANSQQSNPTSNIFANSNPNSGTNVFGGFQSLPNSNASAVSGVNMFPQNNSGSLFGSNVNKLPQLGSMFGANEVENQSNATLLTSASVTPQTVLEKQLQSPFGVNSQQQQNILTSVSSGNKGIFGEYQGSCSEEIYTPFHMLSEEDRAEFERDVFIKIPLVPPPRELCV